MTSSCQIPSRMPIASTRGHAAARMRWSLFPAIAHRPRPKPHGDLVREPRHLERVELTRPGDVDVPHLRDAPWTGGHQHNAVAEAHGLANVVGDKDDRLAGLLPDPVQVVVKLIAGERVERSE